MIDVRWGPVKPPGLQVILKLLTGGQMLNAEKLQKEPTQLKEREMISGVDNHEMK